MIKIEEKDINPNGAMWGWMIGMVADMAIYEECKKYTNQECRTISFGGYVMKEPMLLGDILDTKVMFIKKGNTSYTYDAIIYLKRGDEAPRIVNTLRFVMVVI